LKKFLIIQTAFIGDAILATAVLEKLHGSFPDARIDLLIRKGNESLFIGHPFLNSLLVWDKAGAKYPELFKLLKKVKETRYDHLVNVQRFASMGLFTCLAKADEKIGYDKNPFSFCLDKKIEHRTDGVHEVGRLQALIAHITDGKSVKPRLYPTKQHKAEIANLTTTEFVCIAPTSVWFTKQWPAEKWIELISAFPKELSVYLLGGPSDNAACELIKSQIGVDNVQNLSGKLSLLASAALMEKAKMNYVNDSAPLHLASAMNAPVRGIFCSTVPTFGFGPLSDNSAIIQTDLDLDCRPCGLHGKSTCPKGHFNCAKSIEIENLVSALK